MKSLHHIRNLVLTALLMACAAVPSCTEPPSRVLFLGNSLTYAGNLPQVLEAVCDASGTNCETEMIAEGGATLSQRAQDHTLERATKAGGRFEFLVLQERGGDHLYLSSRPEVTAQAAKAAETLVSQAARHNMKPILLGTYQGSPRVSEDLVAAEANLATKLNVSHVPVSAHLQCGRQRYPSLPWMGADGMHPGPVLTLLMAILLQQELFAKLPPPMPISVTGPIYEPTRGPRATGFASAQPVRQGTATSVNYGKEAVEAVLQLLREPC